MNKSEPKKKEIIVPRDFVHWWEPWGNDQITGASIGGHPDAERLWARPEVEGGYARRLFGTKTKQAWMSACYRNEYEEWRQLGCPERTDFVSLAASVERQDAFWHELAPTIAMIGLQPRMKRAIQRYSACPQSEDATTAPALTQNP